MAGTPAVTGYGYRRSQGLRLLSSCVNAALHRLTCPGFWILNACKPPATQPTEQPPPPQQPVPVPSSSTLIQQNLTDSWENFRPDLPDIEEPPAPLDDLWAQIRLTTAPWGTDIWDDSAPPTPPSSIGDTGSERERAPSDTSRITTPSSVASHPGSGFHQIPHHQLRSCR